jgi:hypothetical protein
MQVVDATSFHVNQFAYSQVRQVDIDEWVLGTGVPYRDLLTKRLDVETQYVRALLDDGGVCIALWGVEDNHGIGNVWLIANTEAEKVGTRIHRFWPEEVGYMHMQFDTLKALAFRDNALHIKWLNQIGFTPEADYLVGSGKVPFTLFTRSHPCARHLH